MKGYTKHHITQADIVAVSEALRGEYITRSDIREKFEEALRERTGDRFLFTCQSGSQALDIALAVLPIPDRCKIGFCPLTFRAGLNCIYHNDMIPVSIDCDENGLIKNLASHSERDFSAVIITEYAGQEYDFKGEKKWFIVRDACHTLGGRRSPKWADISVYSFHPAKIITTGEGGAIGTSDERIADKITRLRDNYDKGWNAHLSEINCALGLSQLSRIDDRLMLRQKQAEFYIKNGLPTVKNKSVWHIFPLLCRNGYVRDLVRETLSDIGYDCPTHYVLSTKMCDNCCAFVDREVTLPLGEHINIKDQRKICFALKKYFI